jgi:8-oxo-dGTP pyrophosphatase MutT (NUDIX family)
MRVMPEQVRQHLAQIPTRSLERPLAAANSTSALRSAAVLIPLLETRESWHLLYIRRAEQDNDNHSGQVAFPGGCFEPDDADLEATALREAYEEIGLIQEDVQILGRLCDVISGTNYRIRPYIGIMPWPYPLHLAASEVAHAFTIPLHWLADPNNRETYEHLGPSGAISVIRFQAYAGEILWGATARMTVSLIQALTGLIDSDRGR